MKRPSLVFVLSVLVIGLPAAARAAEPAAGGSNADPFAPPPQPKEPSIEEQEEAVLGTPAQPAPATPPAETRPPPPPRRPPSSPRVRRAQANDEAGAPANPGGVAIELSTSGFASGSLAGGLFVGGRISAGTILGGFLDYRLESVSSTPPGDTVEVTTSKQAFRIGVGLRQAFVQSADRLVDLYGAADLSFDYSGAEVLSTGGGSTPTQSPSASGFSLALGPGLRLWVHEQIAIGYLARFRLAYLSGGTGALTNPPTAETLEATATAIGFEGTFQILGVF